MVSEPRTTVAEALRLARRRGIERLDAQQALGELLQRPRSWLLAHDHTVLDAAQWGALDAAWTRLAQGEPLAYVLGSAGFYGLTLAVTPQVLVPRSDTEGLVDWALELLQADLGGVPRPRVLDLGTGSGAVALAVKHRHPRAAVTATDLSAEALAVARANAQRLGLEVMFAQGSWFDATPAQAFELVLSNPPYIAPGDVHLPALRHEPALALLAAEGGLGALRAIVQGARARLAPGAWLLLEHGHDQADAVRALLQDNGFAPRRDAAGRARCTGGAL